MEPTSHKKTNDFSNEISKKEKLKMKALLEKNSVWAGLGMMGMVGWSVTVPALLGAIFGMWLDKNHAQSFSWTLTFLLIGIIAGGIIAWFWILKEDNEIHKNNRDHE